MNKPFVVLSLAALLTSRAGAMDVGYWISVEAGTAAASGDAIDSAVGEFGYSVGASAVPAPVLGAALGAGAEAALRGPLRAVAGLELRRLGYAFWAPDSGATSWLALWAAGVRLGVRWEAGPWFAGAGGSALAPVGGVDQAASQGGSGITVDYDAGAGRTVIPGGYLEAGLSLAPGRTAGSIVAAPVVSVFAGFWPGGIVDGTEALQAQVSLAVAIKLRERTSR